jgi:hypothetical protein
MAQLTHAQYDALERAVTERSRISVFRRGTEYVVVPLSLATLKGREAIEARNPVTGDAITLYLDDIDAIEVVR